MHICLLRVYCQLGLLLVFVSPFRMTRFLQHVKEVIRFDLLTMQGGFVWLFYGSNNFPADERPPIPYVSELDDPTWKPVYGEFVCSFCTQKQTSTQSYKVDACSPSACFALAFLCLWWVNTCLQVTISS